MIWLGNLLVSLVTSVVGYFGAKLSQKTIFATAALAAFVALTSACILAIKAIAMAIVFALPGWAAPWIGMLLPGNTAACIGAIVAARTAVTIYRYHVEGLKIASYIT
jgi:amino acid transporter